MKFQFWFIHTARKDKDDAEKEAKILEAEGNNKIFSSTKLNINF